MEDYMNRIIGIVLLFVGILVAAETTSFNDFDAGVKPSNIHAVQIVDGGSSESSDSLSAAEVLYIGPINLTADRNSPMYKGFGYFLGIVTGTTPVAAFDYTLLSGPDLSDTTGSWTLVDTLTTSAQSGYVSLSDKAANYIVFRINNYDATTTSLPNPCNVYFKRDEVYNNDKRK